MHSTTASAEFNLPFEQFLAEECGAPAASLLPPPAVTLARVDAILATVDAIDARLAKLAELDRQIVAGTISLGAAQAALGALYPEDYAAPFGEADDCPREPAQDQQPGWDWEPELPEPDDSEPDWDYDPSDAQILRLR